MRRPLDRPRRALGRARPPRPGGGRDLLFGVAPIEAPWGRGPRRRSGRLGRAALLASLALALAFRNARASESRPGLVSFRRVASPEDVPAHTCTALAQDRDGFLWIGTQAGLVRYDGYEFRVFAPRPGDPTSLGGRYVRALFATSDGRLLVGTFADGLSIYDPATERFARFRNDGADGASLSHDRVEALAEDRAGSVWVGTSGGLDRLDPKSGRVERFRHRAEDPASLADDRVRALLVDRAGTLWVGTYDGLQRRRADGSFERVASDAGTPGSLAGELVSRLFEDARGRIWIGTSEHGAALLDPADGSLRRFRAGAGPNALGHYWVYGFAEVGAGEIWIATFGGGIDVVDAASLAVVDRLRHDPAIETTPGGDRIGALLRDASGAVWVGTWGQGLALHDPSTRAFRTFRHSPIRTGTLSHPSAVRAIGRSDGTIWVGTNGNGVDVLDLERGVVGGYRADAAERGSLADGSVTCLAEGRDGTMWVATLSGALHRLRPGARRFDRLTRADGLAGGPIRCLTFGPDGALWAGSAEGMARIDPATLRIESFRHRPDDTTTLSSFAVEAIAFTPEGAMWVGTDAGLNTFDPARGTAVRIAPDPRRADGLPAGWVPDLLVTRNGRLVVATPAGAVLLASWDGRTARFESLAARVGRPPAGVEALVEDDAGKIWLGPRLRVDPTTWRAEEFSRADGPDFASFFIASRGRTANGALLFGSPEGLLLVEPERIAPWTFAPRVALTSLRVDGVELRGAAARDRLTLPPTARRLAVEFAALDLTAPRRALYRHRLDGFDADWTTADASRRSHAYTNLPPGTYTFRVQGSNRAGAFSPHELRLAVTVLPAFHQTAWFRALAALLALALVYGGVRLRVRALEARSRRLEGVVAERTAELRAAYARIEEASLTDPLTGLRNRRFLEQAIGADVELSTRRHRGAEPAAAADLGFLLVDLDHFKSVNDTYGHAAGDAVLVETAALLRGVVRASDTVVRWGGEEFLVVARFVDRAALPDLAEKLRAAVEARSFVLPDGTRLARTASIGFAPFPFSPERPEAASWEAVVHLADVALYASKRNGRNRWTGLSCGAPEDLDAALRLSSDELDAAVARGAVRLVSPPLRSASPPGAT